MISSKAQEYREELVKKLCDAMESGTAPWQKTWTDGDAPFNAVSGWSYHGINSINLALQSQALGHADDPRWLTFDQAKEKGWHVKPGEKGTHVEFYKFDEKPKVDEFGDPVLDEDGKQEVEKSVLVRNYVVFHASQIEGIPAYEPPSRNPIETSEKAERILKESGAEIRHGGNEAFYSLTGDYIQVPERGQFNSQADYYATCLHELGHWTGHPSRLNRETSSDMNSETYAKEELVAEISSMFVSAETGIPQTQEHFDNHAAYVDHWVKAIKEDPNALFRAVSQAQKASEEILKYERVREREQAQTQTEGQKPALTEQTIRDMKLIEGDTKVFLKPRVDGQQYKGKILHVDESQGYCVQQVGRQSLVVHKLERIMDNDSPVSLYLVLNPTNIQRLKPLVRLFISQLVFILMPEMEFSGGQMKAPYKHRLLLLLDEFPALGKLGIFEQAIAYFGGWNIKAYLICQDKAQLDAAYGKDESITSNCHVTVAYAPNKVETAKYLSDRLGVTTVIKEQESISFQGGTGLFAKKSVTKSQQEVQRAVLTPDEIMRLPGPIKDVYQNITEPGDMLVFAAGFPPVYGKQILYFLDKTFSGRSKINAPEKSDFI